MLFCVNGMLTTVMLLLAHLELGALSQDNITSYQVNATTLNVIRRSTGSGRSTPSTTLVNEIAESRKRFQNTIDTIFNDYRKYLSPTEGALNARCWLNITTTPVALVELEEVEERLSTILDFRLMWSDERLAWNFDETMWYEMSHDPTMVWTPNIEVGNPHDSKVSQRSQSQRNVLNVLHDGTVSWHFVKPIDTTCEVDTMYYPFDRQVCEIELITKMNMFGCAIHFEHHIPPQKLENGNWRFVEHWVYEYETQEGHARYYTANLVYMFERKPTSHLIIYIVPLFILVSLTPLVFLLPKNGGDRMGLALTVLLAVSVYMTLVADRLPDASEPVPIVTCVFFVWYISNTMIVIIVLVNSRINRMNPKRPVPRLIQKFVFFTARLCCIADPEEEEAILANQNGAIVEGDENHCVLTSEKKNRHYKITWKLASSALDKWLVIGLYTGMMVFAISIGTWLYNGDKDKMPYKELEEGQVPYFYEDYV